MIALMVALALVQDPVQKNRPPVQNNGGGIVEIQPVEEPAPPQAQDPAKKSCDGKCHQMGIEPMVAKMCEQCKQAACPCMHAKFCKECADRKKVCAWCAKPLAGSAADVMGRLQAGLDKALPGHRAGRSISKKPLPRVTFFLVVHDGTPCTSCPKHAEALAAIEYKDEKDTEGQVRILTSEKDLSELLARQKPGGKEEAALCAAELAQALWESKKGGVEPSSVKDVKIVDGKAKFTIVQGEAARTLVVTLNEQGEVTGLSGEE